MNFSALGDANRLEISLGEVWRTAREHGRGAPPLGADGLGTLEGNAYREYGFPDDDGLCR
jgi:hypothetical protein